MRKLKNILVTGGAGFIGCNFIHYLMGESTAGGEAFTDSGFDGTIVNVDCLTYAGNAESLKDIEKKYGGKRYFFEKVDICDRPQIERILKQYDIDTIIHFAAESHVDRSILGPEAFMKTNVMGTFTLLDCARNFWKKEDGSMRDDVLFHHISTDEVYGSLGETGYFLETTPYDPRSPYSSSKASSDHIVMAYFHTYGLPITLSNCTNNYGPFQFPEKLIPLMIHNALEGKALPVYGDGKNVRDWLYVEDHAKAIDMVQEQGRLFETYNIGGHNEKQNIEIVQTIIDVLRESLDDSDPRKEKLTYDLITYVEDRKGHDRRYAIAPDKIKKEIGWEPETMFKEGIRKTIEWFFAHEDWMEHVTSGDYQKYYDSMYSDKF